MGGPLNIVELPHYDATRATPIFFPELSGLSAYYLVLRDMTIRFSTYKRIGVSW